MMDRAVTLFPHPDSPTSAKVSPSAMSKETPSTARAGPSLVWKYVFRSHTRSSIDSLGPQPRIERIAHGVAKHVGRQHQAEHEDKGSKEIPPHHRVASEFEPGLVNHVSP